MRSNKETKPLYIVPSDDRVEVLRIALGGIAKESVIARVAAAGLKIACTGTQWRVTVKT